ncbi:MAG: cell division protein FtsL [Eubacteriales bacterium]
MGRTYSYEANKRQTTYSRERRTPRYVETSTARKYRELQPARPTKKVSRAVRKNRERASHFSIGSLLSLTLALAAVCYILGGYVNIQAEITTATVEIASLEKELNTIKTLNDETQNRITASIDLSEIARIATEELGMSHATAGQVVPYTSIDGDYVRQINDIPTN